MMDTTLKQFQPFGRPAVNYMKFCCCVVVFVVMVVAVVIAS